MNVNFKSNRVKLRKQGEKIMQNFASDNTDSVFCIERSRINILVICLQFCKLMFGQSNFVKSLFSHNRVKTYDCGERIAGWFSMFLGRPCRLIRQSSDMKKKSDQKNIKGMFSFLKIFVIPHLVKHQAHGLHAEYKNTLIKGERVIQYWFNRFQRVQIYPNCVCAALLLLTFGENVQIHQSGGAGCVIMTMILSVNSMIILKTDHEISRNKVFILRLNFIIKRIKLKEHGKSIDIALVNCFTNLVKSQLCLGF